MIWIVFGIALWFLFRLAVMGRWWMCIALVLIPVFPAAAQAPITLAHRGNGLRAVGISGFMVDVWYSGYDEFWSYGFMGADLVGGHFGDTRDPFGPPYYMGFDTGSSQPHPGYKPGALAGAWTGDIPPACRGYFVPHIKPHGGQGFPDVMHMVAEDGGFTVDGWLITRGSSNKSETWRQQHTPYDLDGGHDVLVEFQHVELVSLPGRVFLQGEFLVATVDGPWGQWRMPFQSFSRAYNSIDVDADLILGGWRNQISLLAHYGFAAGPGSPFMLESDWDMVRMSWTWQPDLPSPHSADYRQATTFFHWQDVIDPATIEKATVFIGPYSMAEYAGFAPRPGPLTAGYMEVRLVGLGWVDWAQEHVTKVTPQDEDELAEFFDGDLPADTTEEVELGFFDAPDTMIAQGLSFNDGASFGNDPVAAFSRVMSGLGVSWNEVEWIPGWGTMRDLVLPAVQAGVDHLEEWNFKVFIMPLTSVVMFWQWLVRFKHLIEWTFNAGDYDNE